MRVANVLYSAKPSVPRRICMAHGRSGSGWVVRKRSAAASPMSELSASHLDSAALGAGIAEGVPRGQQARVLLVEFVLEPAEGSPALDGAPASRRPARSPVIAGRNLPCPGTRSATAADRCRPGPARPDRPASAGRCRCRPSRTRSGRSAGRSATGARSRSGRPAR